MTYNNVVRLQYYEAIRYKRLTAERFARQKGYDPKRLRQGRYANGLTVYPISGEQMAIAVDETEKASLCMWPFYCRNSKKI